MFGINTHTKSVLSLKHQGLRAVGCLKDRQTKPHATACFWLPHSLLKPKTAKQTHISPIFIKIKRYSASSSGWGLSTKHSTTIHLSDLREARGPRWGRSSTTFAVDLPPRLQESYVFSVVRKQGPERFKVRSKTKGTQQPLASWGPTPLPRLKVQKGTQCKPD